MARKPGVLDGVMRCTKCGGFLVKIGSDYRCMEEAEPEELVATGFIPSKDSSGKLQFETAKDQQSIQISQALSHSVEVDNAYLEQLGLNPQKILERQIQLGLVP